MNYPGWWSLFQVEDACGHGEHANLGALVVCPDLRWMDCLMSSDGSAQDLRAMRFLGLSQHELSRRKKAALELVANLSKTYMDDPHPDLEKRREFIRIRVGDALAMAFAHFGCRFTELHGIVVGDDPCFDVASVYRAHVEWLPPAGSTFQTMFKNELAYVLSARQDLDKMFVGGEVDFSRRMLILLRGDGRWVEAPFSSFKPSGTSEPNFSDFEIIDHGLTIRLGTYESSSEAILATAREVC